MIEIRWNNFRAKFEGRADKAFELLCYLLFLREHRLPEKGLFGYYNQIGIETEPVLIDGEWVGFQAKYSDSQVNVSAIEESLGKAKRKHPDLQKVVVYVNHEFTETRKTTDPPKSQSDLEKFAASLGLTIDWRVRSNFASLLSLPENQDFAEHFFVLEPGRSEFLTELKRHTAELLDPIRTLIEIRNTTIKLDRTKELERLNSIGTPGRLIVVHGPGGVGKTSLLKEFSKSVGDAIPLLVFRASEFNVRHINDFFTPYGRPSLSYFIDVFSKADRKYLVVDSAEKLSDLDDHVAFREFLRRLIDSGWTIFLTARDVYLDSLTFQLVNVFGRSFEKVTLTAISDEELDASASAYKYALPSSERLRELIRNPFYLAEYLLLTPEGDIGGTYGEFKKSLWKKKIRSSGSKGLIDRRREETILAIARHRADSGSFTMSITNSDAEALQALELDEVLGFDEARAGYFITHDIYEEWSLEKIIEQNFERRASTSNFFASIGNSLPMRRAFRHWLSDRLRDAPSTVKQFVEQSIADTTLGQHWRDEVLISVLLSDASEAFFDMFEQLILIDDCELLIRLIFLLRTGCKEIDFTLAKAMREFQEVDAGTLFTRPIGSGWTSAISFTLKHIDKFLPDRIPVIVSLLEDWTRSNKLGTGSRTAGLIALTCYNSVVDEDTYADSKMVERLVTVMFNSATEIKPELEIILDEVISAGQVQYRQRHYQVIHLLCSEMAGYTAAQALPVKTMKVAELYWMRSEGERADDHMGVERLFDIRFVMGNEYFPASAFQTPMIAWLRAEPFEAFKFLQLLNEKTIGHYSKFDPDPDAEEINIDVDGKRVVQYVDARVWNMYRATQVAPSLLESMHMALERILFEMAEVYPEPLIVSICKKLLSKSNYGSITAVVTSVVLAQPGKLFDVAKILFADRTILLQDNIRKHNDATSARHLYTIPSMGRRDIDHHVQERLETCDQEHRKWSLEDLARNYQYFDYFNDPKLAAERQSEIWEILDRHYYKLPPDNEQSEDDRAWRMALARMDRRKITTKVEAEEGTERMIVSFHPEIAPDLQDYQEEGSTMTAQFTEFLPLKLWAIERFEKRTPDENQFDGDPSTAFEKSCEITARLEDIKEQGERSRFWLINGSTPSYVSAILLRDHFDELSPEQVESCAEVLLNFATLPLIRENYFYQSGDGVEPAITSLGVVFARCPELRTEVKEILLLHLLSRITDTSILARRSILQHLWKTHPADAESLLCGFLSLKASYDKLAEKHYFDKRRNWHNDNAEEVVAGTVESFSTIFAKENVELFGRVNDNEIELSEFGDFNDIPAEVLSNALDLLPLGTDAPAHKELINLAGVQLSEPDILADADSQSGFLLKRRTMQKFANLVISAVPSDAVAFVRPFVETFNSSVVPDLFEQLIFAEDELRQYESFWEVWQAFYPKLVEHGKTRRWRDRPDRSIRNYFLAWEYWKTESKSWPSIRDREKVFFQNAVRELGQHPSAFYGISRFLNEIGSSFLNEGIGWISDLLKLGPSPATESPETNTTYYLELLARRYADLERRTIRSSPEARDRIIRILDYLVEQGSINAFLLRDQLA